MSRRQQQKGQVILLYTFASTAMLGLLGMAVNVGWMYFREQAIQSAAEAAALAGVQAAVSSSSGAITCGSSVVCQSATLCTNPLPSSPSSNADNACMYASDNGFVASTSGQKVYIAGNTTAPPVSNLSTQYWVSATVSETSPTGFLSIFGVNSAVVSKRATAGLVGGIQGDCIYVLDTAASGALTVTGTGDLQSGCGVWVASSNSKALQVTGNATMVVSSGAINLMNNGNDSGSNSVGANDSCTRCLWPSPTLKSSALSDPLSTLTAPTVGSCDHIGYSTSSDATLSQGVYCGGITISGGTVKFNSGTYILLGGGLNISGGPTVTGSGVMFYNTGNLLYPYTAVSVAGHGTVTLSAATSGMYNNILFFGDRSKGGTLYQDSFSGGASVNLTGAIYFKNDQVLYAGGSSSSVPAAAIVADEVTVTGNAFLNGGLSAGGGAGTKIALIE